MHNNFSTKYVRGGDLWIHNSISNSQVKMPLIQNNFSANQMRDDGIS
jgi:hypothetical protein